MYHDVVCFTVVDFLVVLDYEFSTIDDLYDGRPYKLSIFRKSPSGHWLEPSIWRLRPKIEWSLRNQHMMLWA